jgi:hypothetical protein
MVTLLFHQTEMDNETNILTRMLEKMVCMYPQKDALGEWHDCIESNARQDLVQVPLCPRCKVKARLNELTINLTGNQLK